VNVLALCLFAGEDIELVLQGRQLIERVALLLQWALNYLGHMLYSFNRLVSGTDRLDFVPKRVLRGWLPLRFVADARKLFALLLVMRTQLIKLLEPLLRLK
jgi:hypothetical protein